MISEKLAYKLFLYMYGIPDLDTVCVFFSCLILGRCHMEISVLECQSFIFDLNCLCKNTQTVSKSGIPYIYKNNLYANFSDITPYVRLGAHKFALKNAYTTICKVQSMINIQTTVTIICPIFVLYKETDHKSLH